MNKIFLIGNLSKDVELTTTNSGLSVARFTLACQRKFENAEGERDADFINIVAWRGLADNCQKYLKKGSKCCVVGSLQNRSYKNAEGEKKYTTEVIANEVEFLGAKKVTDNGEQPKPSMTVIEDDNLPF